MPRQQKITVAGKEVIVAERKVKELEQLVNEIIASADGLSANTALDGTIKDKAFDLLYKCVPKFFGLTKKDMEDAYPSELEDLVEAFIEVNFQGVRKLGARLLSSTSLTRFAASNTK